MSVKSANTRIIFGLKVRQLRTARGLSFADLSVASGLSVSYLNEIEKGKKYPKDEKIQALAKALQVPMQELVSMELQAGLAPVGDLLRSNFLNELPLELFGIDLAKVIEIIANAPKRVGAFISTLVELSRNYSLREENFYFGALRSYLEMHNNYFEEIEAAVRRFMEAFQIPPSPSIPLKRLEAILREEFGYTVLENGLEDYPELSELRAVFLPNKKQLLLNGSLTDRQRAFQFGKELGFAYLKLKERAFTSSILKINSFEEVLSHFKAGYFSAALLIQRDFFVPDMQRFFQQPGWQPQQLLDLLDKYKASPEMLMQRMTNLMPEDMDMSRLFLLRFIHSPKDGHFRIDKELHLQQQHQPHGNGIFEHYCRRWIAISSLQDLQENEPGTIVARAQVSRFHGTQDQYLSITLARAGYPTPEKNVSVTLGVLLDQKTRAYIQFLNDPAIQTRVVNKTCERCSIMDCAERVAEPTIIRLRDQRRAIQQTLQDLIQPITTP